MHFARWAALRLGVVGILVAVFIFLTLPSRIVGNIPDPLAPPATESPRATLASFQKALHEAEKIIRETYEGHINEPGLFQSQATAIKVRTAQAYLDRAIRCFDTSEISPSARARTALEAALQLQEVIERIKLPETEAIPDVAAMKTRIERGERPQWTIPNTELRIARVDTGPRTGEYLFTAETINRMNEFYRLARHLPGEDHFDFYEYYALSPGDLMPPKWYAHIRRLPPWFLAVQNDHARWQWIGLATTIVVAILFCFAVYHWTWRASAVRWLPPILQSVLLPFAILLAAYLSELFVEELNITGPVRRNLATGFEAIAYIAFAWLIAALVNRSATLAAASWGAHSHSFDTGIIRVAVRVIGIGLATGVLVYGASQIGVPLVGILAGLGVGGLAVALAAQPTLENLIGGVMIYVDRPVRVGDHCKFGDMTGVVEEIGIRSTRLRAPDRSLITIPNADFSKFHIVNYSRRDQLLFNAKIGIQYGAKQEQLNAILAGMRNLLKAHPGINSASTQVQLANFGGQSIEIDVTAEMDDTRPEELGAAKEKLLMQLSKVVEQSGASLAGHQ
jgi:MscS family membrane protein